jgi:hypothetical protein
MKRQYRDGWELRAARTCSALPDGIQWQGIFRGLSAGSKSQV